jgi:class 3 adenylate cyclase/ABC-type transport system involved in cytochrome c biogenesis ATPase subunit/tetratricopeptide (TPR) repeat protein
MTESLRAALDRLGLADFYDVLAANEVDTAAIAELTEADLRELGLTLGQRKRFVRARKEALNGPAESGQRTATGRGAAPTGERRQLTSLFCDLVGSTPLALRLDPEDFSEVIRVFQDACAGAITRGSGYVAQYLGDGILAYFGYPRASEDDAQSAARAALDIVAKVGQLRTPDGDALKVRVGIATGLVVVGQAATGGMAVDQAIFGETLNLAARLQGAAGPGEIIISEATRNLCGALFDYEQRGDMALKGFPEPVTIYRLLGENAAQSRFDARASAGLHPFVGREVELDTLIRCWRAAKSGSGQVVQVRGEAGIGKSRLARAFIEQLGQERPGIVRWNCAAHLANRALHPIVRDIESRVGVWRTLSPGERRAGIDSFVAASPALGPDDAGFLIDLLGIDSDARAELDAATRARRTNDALARWLEGMTDDAPVLILLEDAHWADAATLDFLTMFVDRLRELPMLLLVTHRPEFTAPWKTSGNWATIALDPLDATAGASLLTTVLGQRALPASVVHTILEKAGGVPLFVEELAKTVLEAVLNRSRVSEALAALTIPSTLQDSLMARLDQLGEIKELAQIGSVIGREFTEAMLRAIAPDHPDIEGGLRRLCDSGLANEASEDGDRMIVFHHALVQDAAYESLLKKRRRDLHRDVAEAMLAGDPAFAGAEPEVIARHCSMGGLRQPAVSHWLAAGMHALDRAANLPALAYLRSALDDLQDLRPSLERSKTELAIQMALAPAAMAIHGWASPQVEQACSRASQLATELEDPSSMFGSAWGLWTHYFLRGEMDLALSAAQSVDAMATAAGTPVMLVAADHAVGFTLYFRGELASALARAEQGAARCDDETDQQIARMFQLSSASTFQAIVAPSLWMMGREAESSEALERSLEHAEKLGHPPSIVFSLAFNSWMLLHKRDWIRMRPYAIRTIAMSEDEGFQMWLPLGHLFKNLCDAAEGRLESGLAAGFEAFERFAATGTGVCQSHVHAPLGEFLIEAGRAEEAVHRLDARIESAIRRQERIYLSELYRVRALAHRDLGAIDQAHADIAVALKIARSQGALTFLRRAEASQDTLKVSRPRTVNHSNA